MNQAYDMLEREMKDRLAAKDAEIEKLKSTNQKMQQAMQMIIEGSAEQFAKATGPVFEKLLRALSFYANEKNYFVLEKYQDGDPEISAVQKDRGKIARDAIPMPEKK